MTRIKTITTQKFYLLVIIAGAALGSCADKKESSNIVETTTEVSSEATPNTLTAAEKEGGWEILFDGTTTNGWRGYNKGTFPATGWSIDGNALKVNGSGAGEAGNGGDIIYDKQYKDFELTLEWKVSEGGNSGIFYLAKEIAGEPIYKSAPEMQILDNDKHPDSKLGKNGNRKAGALYDLIPADPQNAKPAGQWNKVVITVYRGTVIHNQNGENVLEYHLWTDEWKKMVADSKFKDWPNFVNAGGDDKRGFIGLQDHGDDVWFRNIKIKKL